jgi:hypothetical protein
MQLPPHALNAPRGEMWGQAKSGAVRPHPGCGRTLGCLLGHRLWRVGFWLGLDLFHVGSRSSCDV